MLRNKQLIDDKFAKRWEIVLVETRSDLHLDGVTLPVPVCEHRLRDWDDLARGRDTVPVCEIVLEVDLQNVEPTSTRFYYL